MAMLAPDIAILDETDSGLDIDALRTVAEGVQRLHDEQGLGALIITHYQRILHYVEPQFVHVMMDGRIVLEGGVELVERLEREGYDQIRQEFGASWSISDRSGAVAAGDGSA
jgi:Fe-S cluster assembly ATP-binding protein